jgi:predicted extracellular nuclease
VDALNAAAGETRFASVQLPAGRVSAVSGLGYVDTGDAISVGIIYQIASVRPAPGTRIAVLDDAEAAGLPNAGELDFPVFDGNATNRAALAASFQEIATGEVFTVVANHFKSKGDSGLEDDATCQSTPAANLNCDQGDGQGYWNARRTDAANAVAAWIAAAPTGSLDPDYLILGDLNAYGQEDPIAALSTAGWMDLFADDPDAYSFVFDGQWGYLDYALANAAMAAQVAAAAEWHANADEPSVLGYSTAFKSANQISLLFSEEPYRTSDHDPLLVGLDLATAGAPVAGDLDGNGTVDFADRTILVAALGTSGGDVGHVPGADFDGDGTITFNDYRIWFGYWRAAL